MSHPPKGTPVNRPVPAHLPSPTKTLTNNLPTITPSASAITLVPLNISHAQELFANLGGPQNDHLYTYMLNGPIHTLPEFEAHINNLLTLPGFFSYSVFSSDKKHLSNQAQSEEEPPKATAIAIICLLNIQLQNLSVEIGHVLFPTTAQRTVESTTINYILMKHAIEDLGFERVEWKCNVENQPSMKAAERLGYKHEGVFRRHMVIKGLWRDTWWGSVLGVEWEPVKKGLEAWLDEKNWVDGSMGKRLESLRSR